MHACACALMLWHMRKCLRTTCRRQFSYHVGSVDPTQVECQKEKCLLSSTYQSKRNPELPGCWLSIWETLEFLLLTIDGWSLFLFGVFMTAHLSSFWVCLSLTIQPLTCSGVSGLSLWRRALILAVSHYVLGMETPCSWPCVYNRLVRACGYSSDRRFSYWGPPWCRQSTSFFPDYSVCRLC